MADFRELRLLIADSQLHFRVLYRSFSIQMGARDVYEASSGTAALELTDTVQPSIILIEWDLPHLGACEFTALLRRERPCASTSIIVLCRHPTAARVQEARSAGCTDFLATPVSFGFFRQRIIRAGICLAA